MTAAQSESNETKRNDVELAESIVRSFGHLSTGDLAGLRRGLNGEARPIFYQILARPELQEREPTVDNQRILFEDRWLLFLAAAATLTDGKRRSDSLRFGHVLGKAGFSSLRAERLMRAPFAESHPFVRDAVRFLASKGEVPTMKSLARFIFVKARVQHSATSENLDNEETAMRNFAHDYYIALHKRGLHQTPTTRENP